MTGTEQGEHTEAAIKGGAGIFPCEPPGQTFAAESGRGVNPETKSDKILNAYRFRAVNIYFVSNFNEKRALSNKLIQDQQLKY